MNLLLISTLSCFLELIVPIVIKYATNRLFSKTKQVIELQNDLVNLKQEMSGLSMIDEFSKYAKLQRKCNKLEGILKEKANDRLSSRLKVQLVITYGFRIINGLLILILLYLYKNEPVIILPKDTLWPVQNILSWPSNSEDSISLMMWIFITRIVVSICKKLDVS